MQRRYAPPIVGRDREIEELTRALYDARQRRGRAVFVIGEWGVGKSRLVQEISVQAAASGMCVLRGRGSRARPTVAFRPLVEAVLCLLRASRPAVDDELGPYRALLGRLVPDFADGGPESHGGPRSPVVLAEAVLRLMELAGRDRGCLMILEDLQDADPRTLAMVEYLADNLDGQPTTLIATTSTDSRHAVDLGHTVARRGNAMVLPLDRLGPVEVRQLAATRLRAAPEQITDQLADILWEDSVGVPRVVHELLHAMLSDRVLARAADGWRLEGAARVEAPATLVSGVVERVERVGPRALALLTAAAVMGRRFRLSVVQVVAGLDDRELIGHLRAALAAGLISRGGTEPDSYEFGHPVFTKALLCHLTRTGRAALARRTAEVIASLYQGLPGEWCVVAAALRLHGGDVVGAARLYAEAGRRELAAGSAGAAGDLLDRARHLLTGTGELGLHADVVGALLDALTEAGQVDRGMELADVVDGLRGACVAGSHLAMLHARLASTALAGGRLPDAQAQVARARALLGPDATDEHSALVDVVEGELIARSSDRGWDRAAKLAETALAKAEASDQPTVVCRALRLLGVLARGQSLDRSAAHFTRVDALAARHRLPVWRLWSLYELGVNDWLAHGDVTRLEHARHEAARLGTVVIGDAADATVAMSMVLRGEFTAAVEETRRNPMVHAVHAGHQGRRQEMESALADGGRRIAVELPGMARLARGFCALLEEDRVRAHRELSCGADLSAGSPLVGCRGLQLLLDVLSGAAGWPQYRAAAAVARSVRWDSHFALLARAVLLGRSTHRGEAAATVARAEHVGAPYPVARHLGLRLVADAACADRWGEPVEWLRRAEKYFHDATVPAVAEACRALLRQAGACTPNRHRNAYRMPPPLRILGVTAREYEVLRLLIDRPKNRSIAERLHISPRTVEKHVAQLISKTGQPDRVALSLYAARVEAETSWCGGH